MLWPLLLAGAVHREWVEALIAAAPEVDIPRAFGEVSNFLATVAAQGLLVADRVDG